MTSKRRKKSELTIRSATGADFLAFYGTEPPLTVRAIAAVKDGRVVGIGGYYLDNGMAVAFTDINDEMTKRDKIAGGRAVINLLKRFGGRIVAEPGENGPVAMKHFGFTERGGVWGYDRN